MNTETNTFSAPKELLNTVVQNISSALFIINQNFEIQQFNKAFLEMFHLTKAETHQQLTGNALGCAFMVENEQNCGTATGCEVCSLRNNILGLFLHKIPVYKKKLIRHFYIAGKKTLKFLQYTAKTIDYEKEEMILVIVNDITQIETQRQELEKLNHAKNRLLGIAAHDLRNPIAAIQSLSDILISRFEHFDKEEIIEVLSDIYRESEFSLRLLNDLLDVTKIETGNFSLKPTRGNYEDFVKNNIESNKILATRKNIGLFLDVKEEIPEFCFDKTRVQQLLNNLLSNAIKYSESGTKIHIALSKENDSFVVTKISDQGQGIPASELSELFVEFHTTSTQPTNNEKSTGLGLAIAKQIVEGHGGKIWAESVVGKGSKFTFKLRLIN